MDFEEFSKKTILEIDKELEKLLSDWRKEVAVISKDFLPLIDKFISGSKGGKRVRGSLVVLGYQLSMSFWQARNERIQNLDSGVGRQGRPPQNDIYKIAAAYEIFHTAILTHDDVIDESLLRRGQPSLYQALGGNHYGASQAICLADAGFFLAVKIISESSFPEKEKNEALRRFSRIMLSTVLGEMLDVEKGDVSTIMKLKTAEYTISGPLQLSAVLGGADQKLIKRLGEFGENLGVAFQIQDDILGVFGSPEQTGKSITSDIEEGKNTLLHNHALKKANSLQKQFLEEYYGKSNIGDQEVEEVRQVFKETGALDYAKKQTQEYKGRAMKVIPGITKDPKMSKLLEQAAEYLVERNK